MQVLAFWGAVRSIGSTAGPVFLSMGKPQILVQLQLLLLSTLAILIYPLSFTFSILGTSLAVCLASILPNILAILYVARLVDIDSSKLASEIFIPLFNTILMIIVILCIKLLFLKLTGLINFCLLILCGITSYSIITYFFERRRNYPIITITKDIIKTSQPWKTAE
jgi:O-antigen/teichoic acid export membrane protein